MTAPVDDARRQAWREAGLWDPGEPAADDRLALLEHLAERGATDERLVAARDGAGLVALAADLVADPEVERVTLEEAAATLGVDVDLLATVWRAVGFPALDPHEGAVTAEELEALAGVAAGVELLGADPLVRLSRVIGSSLARIADAAVATFLREVESPIVDAGASDLVLARAGEQGVEALLQVPDAIRVLFRRHVATAIRRSRAARTPSSSLTINRLAVAFVDVVGSTAVASRVGAAELADAMGALEAAAFDAVAGHDARVVKLIGDEVMLVAVEPADALRAVRLLAAAADEHPVLPELRAGIALGDLVPQGGDWFGPDVVLAARAVRLAQPGQALLSTAAHDALAAAGVLAPQEQGPGERHVLRGFDEPVVLHPVPLRAPSGASTPPHDLRTTARDASTSHP